MAAGGGTRRGVVTRKRRSACDATEPSSSYRSGPGDRVFLAAVEAVRTLVNTARAQRAGRRLADARLARVEALHQADDPAAQARREEIRSGLRQLRRALAARSAAVEAGTVAERRVGAAIARLVEHDVLVSQVAQRVGVSVARLGKTVRAYFMSEGS